MRCEASKPTGPDCCALRLSLSFEGGWEAAIGRDTHTVEYDETSLFK